MKKRPPLSPMPQDIDYSSLELRILAQLGIDYAHTGRTSSSHPNISNLRRETLVAVSIEGTENSVEHLCEILRSRRFPCLRSGQGGRFGNDREKPWEQRKAGEGKGFYTLTIEPEWVAALTRAAVALTSKTEVEFIDHRPVPIDPGAHGAQVRYQPPTERRERRVDQPVAAARVLGALLVRDRLEELEACWRLGGAQALEAHVVEAMHANGMTELLITGAPITDALRSYHRGQR